MSLSALLERVEGATGPDREIDFALHEAAIGERPEIDGGSYFVQYGDSDFTIDLPDYTASVDAVLALIGRVMPDADFDIRVRKGKLIGVSWYEPANNWWQLFDQPLPLIAALLVAMIGEEAEPSPTSTVTP